MVLLPEIFVRETIVDVTKCHKVSRREVVTSSYAYKKTTTKTSTSHVQKIRPLPSLDGREDGLTNLLSNWRTKTFIKINSQKDARNKYYFLLVFAFKSNVCFVTANIVCIQNTKTVCVNCIHNFTFQNTNLSKISNVIFDK